MQNLPWRGQLPTSQHRSRPLNPLVTRASAPVHLPGALGDKTEASFLRGAGSAHKPCTRDRRPLTPLWSFSLQQLIERDAEHAVFVATQRCRVQACPKMAAPNKETEKNGKR